MDLRQNILDTVKEWEIKIGYRKEAIQLYYPRESLCELLGAKESDDGHDLEQRLQSFCEASEEFGGVEIAETEEKGRYCVRIPSKGVEYIHEHVPENPFLRAFLDVITNHGKKLEDVEAVFHRFSDRVVIEKQEEREWGFWFADGKPDEYVYYVEEDAFGLEYHRFTKDAYRKLFGHRQGSGKK